MSVCVCVRMCVRVQVCVDRCTQVRKHTLSAPLHWEDAPRSTPFKGKHQALFEHLDWLALPNPTLVSPCLPFPPLPFLASLLPLDYSRRGAARGCNDDGWQPLIGRGAVIETRRDTGDGAVPRTRTRKKKLVRKHSLGRAIEGGVIHAGRRCSDGRGGTKTSS